MILCEERIYITSWHRFLSEYEKVREKERERERTKEFQKLKVQLSSRTWWHSVEWVYWPMRDRDGYLTPSKTCVLSRVLDGFETMQTLAVKHSCSWKCSFVIFRISMTLHAFVQCSFTTFCQIHEFLLNYAALVFFWEVAKIGLKMIPGFKPRHMLTVLFLAPLRWASLTNLADQHFYAPWWHVFQLSEDSIEVQGEDTWSFMKSLHGDCCESVLGFSLRSQTIDGTAAVVAFGFSSGRRTWCQTRSPKLSWKRYRDDDHYTIRPGIQWRASDR